MVWVTFTVPVEKKTVHDAAYDLLAVCESYVEISQYIEACPSCARQACVAHKTQIEEWQRRLSDAIGKAYGLPPLPQHGTKQA